MLHVFQRTVGVVLFFGAFKFILVLVLVIYLIISQVMRGLETWNQLNEMAALLLIIISFIVRSKIVS